MRFRVLFVLASAHSEGRGRSDEMWSSSSSGSCRLGGVVVMAALGAGIVGCVCGESERGGDCYGEGVGVEHGWIYRWWCLVWFSS